jgi:hypothetical protein
VSKAWKIVLDEEALGFLLACRIAERRKLFTALESLKKNPYQPGDFIEQDDVGRPLDVKVFGSYLITFWRDSFVNELRVVEIERVRLVN